MTPGNAWADVLKVDGLQISLRRHESAIPSFPPEEWFDLVIKAEGLQMSAHIESAWFEEELQQLAVCLDGIAEAPPDGLPSPLEVNGWRAARVLFTVHGAATPQASGVAVELWLTASGDDESSSMTITICEQRDTFAAAARTVRDLLSSSA